MILIFLRHSDAFQSNEWKSQYLQISKLKLSEKCIKPNKLLTQLYLYLKNSFQDSPKQIKKCLRWKCTNRAFPAELKIKDYKDCLFPKMTIMTGQVPNIILMML